MISSTPKIIHMINNKDVSRGGAQKILKLLRRDTDIIISLENNSIFFKYLNLVKQFFSILNIKDSSSIVVIVHSRIYFFHSALFRLLQFKCVFYCHANYNKRNFLIKHFNFDKYIAVSESVKNKLVCLGINKDKINIIKNPLLIDYNNKNLKQNNSHGFMSVGSLHHWKGIHLIPPILDKLSKHECEYAIFGEGPLKSEIIKISKTLDTLKVSLMGYSPEPFKKTNAYPIVIIPSLEEGFGLVALEAIYYGKIIIYSNLPALDEICENDEFSFSFNFSSNNSFKIAYEKALKASKEVKNIDLEKRSELIQKKFSKEFFLKEYGSYIREIINEQRKTYK